MDESVQHLLWNCYDLQEIRYETYWREPLSEHELFQCKAPGAQNIPDTILITAFRLLLIHQTFRNYLYQWCVECKNLSSRNKIHITLKYYWKEASYNRPTNIPQIRIFSFLFVWNYPKSWQAWSTSFYSKSPNGVARFDAQGLFLSSTLLIFLNQISNLRRYLANGINICYLHTFNYRPSSFEITKNLQFRVLKGSFYLLFSWSIWTIFFIGPLIQDAF